MSFITMLRDGACDPQFLSMLLDMAHCLELPWIAISATGRGSHHEFHLLDYFQRLTLNELIKMREQGDEIPIEDLPHPVCNDATVLITFTKDPQLMPPTRFVNVPLSMLPLS